MKHRREIDGLRALAILPVLLFHAGFSWIPGGFFGVDIFFVISGFLITGIILNELRTTGRFSILGFYERRARRIMPALFLVMIVTTAAACFILFPAQWATYLGSLVSMTYFGSNYFFLSKSGYFDPNVDLNPMLHTWSLAIEEQFYVFFPLLLWLLWRTLKQRNWVAVLGAIALASLLLANHAAINTPDPAFYLLQYRAWELLAGSFAAIALSKRARAFSIQWTSLLGLAMVLVSVFLIPAGLPHPGFITLIPVVGSVLIVLTAGDGTLVNRLLSMKFFVGIGLISYSAYLWHQPMFALFRVTSDRDPSPLSFVPLIALTLGLAALSWKFVEAPFRNRKKFSRRQIFIGTAILLAGTVGVACVGTRQSFQDHRISFAGQSFGNIEDRLGRNYGLSQACDGFEPDAAECRSGANPTVLLWGDSYGRQLSLALENSPSYEPFIQQTLSSCAPILGLASQSDRNGADFAKSCIKFNDDVFAWLSKHKDIKTVIMGSPWTAAVPEQLSAQRDYVSRTTGDTGYKLMKQTFEKVKALGVNVVATYGTPINGNDGGNCIRSQVVKGGNLKVCDWPVKDNLRAAFNKYISPLEKTVPFFSWQPILCPGGQCLVTQGDLFVYLDPGHITKEATKVFGQEYDIMGQMLALASGGHALKVGGHAPGASVSPAVIEDRLAPNYGLSQACRGFKPDSADCRSGSNPDVLVWGDSYAMQLATALASSPTKHSFIQQSLSRCSPILGLSSREGANDAAFASECIGFNDQVFAWLSTHKEIKTVILGSPWTVATPATRSSERDNVVKVIGNRGIELMAKTIKKIKALGISVVATYGTPNNGVDGGQCIRDSFAKQTPLTACDWPLSKNKRAAFNKSLGSLLALAPFWSWDKILCPNATCLVTRNGLFVYRDAGHLTREAAAQIGKENDVMKQFLDLADQSDASR